MFLNLSVILIANILWKMKLICRLSVRNAINGEKLPKISLINMKTQYFNAN